MRKIVVLRRQDTSDERRYLSKNNVNITCLGATPRHMKRGVRLGPFLDPVQQAASMLRQHRRFTRLHDEDDFLRRYIDAIGHHEQRQAGRLHPPRLHEVDTDTVDDRVLGKASELRDRLERESVIG